MKTYDFDSAGNLRMYVDGVLVAVVAPEHVEAFRAEHPDAPVSTHQIDQETQARLRDELAAVPLDALLQLIVDRVRAR